MQAVMAGRVRGVRVPGAQCRPAHVPRGRLQVCGVRSGSARWWGRWWEAGGAGEGRVWWAGRGGKACAWRV